MFYSVNMVYPSRVSPDVWYSWSAILKCKDSGTECEWCSLRSSLRDPGRKMYEKSRGIHVIPGSSIGEPWGRVETIRDHPPGDRLVLQVKGHSNGMDPQSVRLFLLKNLVMLFCCLVYKQSERLHDEIRSSSFNCISSMSSVFFPLVLEVYIGVIRGYASDVCLTGFVSSWAPCDKGSWEWLFARSLLTFLIC